MTTTTEFIAGFEGYAGRAYWDVNAWRLGYGSDTEGPDQVRVTEGMETTKARALQNLALRIPQFQTEAIYGKTGMTRPVWDNLTNNQKTAITSLVYNYGRLPVVITPNDPKKTSLAIGALRTANGGVNAHRRIQEAGLYLEPDAGWTPQPAPATPVPQVPAPQVPIPTTPPSGAPAGLPQISSTIAGLDAAILDHFGAILDALTKQRDAINVRIEKIQTQAAEFSTLEGATLTQLPKPTIPQPVDSSAQPQGPTTMQAILTNILTSWATSALGGVAGGPSVIDVIQNPGNWQHDLPGIATVLLGFVAKDGWVTGGTKQAPVSK